MDEKLIDISLAFTKAYQENYDKDPAIREMACHEALFPGILLPLRKEDYFAGRVGFSRGDYLPLDFNTQSQAQVGYVMNIPTFRVLQKEYPARAEEIEGIIAYWKKESTFVKILEEASDEIRAYQFSDGRTELDDEGYIRAGKKGHKPGSGFIAGSYDTRAAGLMPDYDKLVRLGLPGLYEEIERCEKANPARHDFYQACKTAVGIAKKSLEHYRQEALTLAGSAENDEEKRRFEEMAAVLKANQLRAPASFREAIQLVIIYKTLCRTINHGRLDVAFGDILAHDLDSGVISEEDAINMLIEFWKQINENESPYDARIMIGGLGRRNPENADRFALLAMEATRRLHAVMPVLTLRWTKTGNPALLKKAIEVIGEGAIYPTLYNDDAYVPGCEKIMHVPYEDACAYGPLGCGEMLLMGMSSGSPNSTMRFLKALEAALHNGLDGSDGLRIGPATGEAETFSTYDELEAALHAQIRAALERDVKLHLWNREIAARETAYVFPAMLMDNCLERGKGIHAGGLRYFGANVEGFGMTNTANSLAAIKKTVYDEKKLTLRELVDVLDRNFEGDEELRKELLACPKFGNNDLYVDDIKCRLEDFINTTADEIGIQNGLSWYTVANVNPGGITIGPSIAASADGRKCAETMAVGNSPTPGSDKEGMTSMLLSAAKINPGNGGVVTNMNLSRETVTSDPDKFRKMVEIYFARGGLQLNINCFSKGDLEAALEHPEDYSGLIVRVSGYSARFIDLDKITQKHIMDRTLY